MVNIIRLLVEIIGFVVVVSVGNWKIFLLFFVSLNDDCFHNFRMNNIPVAQLQTASLVEELKLILKFIKRFGKLLPVYRQSFFFSAVLTPQHYHWYTVTRFAFPGG